MNHISDVLQLIDTYCWIHSTFTVYYPGAKVNVNQAHPGVGPILPKDHEDKPKEEILQHKYYQWVCFVLFFQAILFHVPRYVFK